jgi:Ca-activated chloride channel family protein
MEPQMALTTKKQLITTYAIAVSLFAAVATLFYCLAICDTCTMDTFFITADQQGQRLYRQEKYEAAAKRFTALQMRAAALFRAGDFKQAAALYSGVSSAEGAYNHGNALVMQGLYEDAIKSYDRALSLKPGWEDAQNNRRIAEARAERIKKEGGDMTGGKMGADDFIFDTPKSQNQQNRQSQEIEGAASEAGMQAMWLRRVQTRPADFLRAKFAYQYATKPGASENDDN